MSKVSELDEHLKVHDSDFYNEFQNLDRGDNNAIIMNEKFVAFFKKYLPDCLKENLNEKKWI